MEHLAELRRRFPKFNKTTLIGRVSAVSANPEAGEITLGFEAISPPDETFKITAKIPCKAEHIPGETLWYSELWEEGRLIALEGPFEVSGGVLTMIGPDVNLISAAASGESF